jgi:hypothetical protein
VPVRAPLAVLAAAQHAQVVADGLPRHAHAGDLLHEHARHHDGDERQHHEREAREPEGARQAARRPGPVQEVRVGEAQQDDAGEDDDHAERDEPGRRSQADPVYFELAFSEGDLVPDERGNVLGGKRHEIPE